MSVEAEPTLSDLAAIEDEWSVIAAERSVVDAECRIAAFPSELSVRAHRRAVSRLSAVLRVRRAARRVSEPGRVRVIALPGVRSRSLVAVPTSPTAA
ncbi:hypothetical protein GCM10027059_01910 [Myceligenerans halotolerans]